MNSTDELIDPQIVNLQQGFQVDFTDPHNPFLAWRSVQRSWPVYEATQLLDAPAAHSLLGVSPKAGVSWSYASTKRGRQLLREANRNYATSEGNLFIKDGDTLIWLERTNATPQLQVVSRTRKRWSKADLQVLFALLAWPEALTASQPQLAVWAGVSQASAHRALKALQNGNYNYKSTEHWAIHRPTLIERWAEAYAMDLRPSLLLGTFNGRFDSGAIAAPPPGYVLSGASAMVARKRVLAQADTLQVYGAEDGLSFRTHYRLSRNGRGNVELYRRFWSFGLADEAPDLLVYADLLALDNPRDHQAAASLRPNV